MVWGHGEWKKKCLGGHGDPGGEEPVSPCHWEGLESPCHLAGGGQRHPVTGGGSVTPGRSGEM